MLGILRYLGWEEERCGDLGGGYKRVWTQRNLSGCATLGLKQPLLIEKLGFISLHILELHLVHVRRSPMFVFELPTTGSVCFQDVVVDSNDAFSTCLDEASSARANVRTVLKETKRSDGERDFLRVLKVFIYTLIIFGISDIVPGKAMDDYLPHLYAVIGSLDSGDLVLRNPAPGKQHFDTWSGLSLDNTSILNSF